MSGRQPALWNRCSLPSLNLSVARVKHVGERDRDGYRDKPRLLGGEPVAVLQLQTVIEGAYAIQANGRLRLREATNAFSSMSPEAHAGMRHQHLRSIISANLENEHGQR
jgi:hypothetical protein